MNQTDTKQAAAIRRIADGIRSGRTYKQLPVINYREIAGTLEPISVWTGDIECLLRMMLDQPKARLIVKTPPGGSPEWCIGIPASDFLDHSHPASAFA